jgi:two-component system cell cycle sensor histidine kinase/response regulator CckA
MALLTGGMAHNFNNLLEVILLSTDSLFLRKGVQDEGLKSSLEIIRDAAQSASTITRQLLSFGRQHALQPSVLDLGTAISGMDEILRKLLHEDMHLRVIVDPKTSPIYIDPNQFEQILTNLCLNARDAMPGGGSVEILARNANPPLVTEGSFVELVVTDTGVGMPPEVIEKIFDPFFTTKEFHGTGLGLATVYGIVKSSKGEILVESKVGSGSTFRLFFPQAKEEPKRTITRKDRPLVIQGNRTILLIEDQGPLRHITANLLREAGHSVIEANSGQSAQKLWPSISAEVDLVISDIVMPGIDGVELVKNLIKVSGKPLKVLFVSAYSDRIFSLSEFDPHFIHFLPKPFSAQRLFQKLSDIFTEEEPKNLS